MPLSYSNTGSASSALTGLMSSGMSASTLANAKAKGIGSGLSINPSGSVTTLAAPVKAPVVSTPAVKTTPAAAPVAGSSANTSSAGLGTYKGHSITPGSDAQVMAQLQAIDAMGAPTPATTLTTPASMASNASGSTGNNQKAPDGTPSLAGIVGDLVNVAKNGSPAVTSANQALEKFRENSANYVAGINSAPTSARVMQGRDQAVQLANAQTENALASSVTNALTGQGQQITGLGTAAGYANPMQISPGNVAINPLTGQPVASAPTQVPYGTQFLDPATGQPVGGGASTAGGGSLNPVTAIPQYAQQVASGAMSYDQAVAALGGNPAFTSALTQAIHGINPSFSPIQSNANASVVGSTLAQTAQQSNALALASDNAEKALGVLTTAYNNLGALQKTPVPGVNQIVNYASSKSGVGVGATQAYKTAIQEARAAVSQVLSSVGITPTGSENTAMALIPDDAGPDQISAAISTVRQLIQNKNQSYNAPASVPQLGGGAGGTANTTPSGAKGWL